MARIRVSTETSHFYVDLAFYNYLLKCFVVIDLKTENLHTKILVKWICTYECLMN
ncbi:DUF1016 family protein [Legionella lytica]|uniref:DUF1016 family protein n=1 Tax=Legionella lytica TaxID=96232 RepID=A0ABY4YC82_9GAMM|nr:DUF1016 family protein [Legionella lytica]